MVTAADEGARPGGDDDEALLLRYGRLRDEAALGALVKRRFPQALRIARRVLGDPLAADACATDAMARLAGAAAGYVPEGRLDGLLYRVVVNAARTTKQAERRRATGYARAPSSARSPALGGRPPAARASRESRT
jgi:DNA-directed RNA polymerase specialized sigma24 family protein